MEDIKPGWFFIAADGDGIGKLVGRAVIANNVDELHKVSNRIDAAQDFILHWCKSVNGIKISGGGDEFTAAIPPEAKDGLKDLRECIEKSFGYTISVGVGRSLSEAGTALLVAKLRGKDRIVWFNKKIKEDIKKAKRRVREGRASQEEYKLSEAYLEKSENMLCKLHKKESHKTHTHALHKHEEGAHDGAADKEGKAPINPDAEDNRTDDCAYCQDLDAVENADGTAGMHDCDMCRDYDAKNGTSGGMDDCPACKEYDAANQITGGVDGCPYCQEDSLNNSNPDDCQMCNEYNAAQGTKDLENETLAQTNPQQESDHICNCPNCPKGDPGVQAEDTEIHPDDCPECQEMYSDAVENEPGQTGQEDPNMQGHETAEQVLDLLDQEPGAGPATPAQEATQIDNTELPQGDAMKENTSVKENFGPAQKNDISDSERAMSGSAPQPGQSDDQPDMTGVLKDGLDEHAQDQQKQQVLDMVSQTLQGFKANKASLEATKEQNMALYQSCIQMLKSMIELCKLLGLQPKMATPQETPPGTPPADNAPAGPKQAAPGGAAQDPKAQPGAAQ
ncbi:MAG TPA: mCpol domain-containing protein [Rhabdochlamydiaceae bacterium]